MTPETIIKICRRAVARFGKYGQQIKSLEELAELSVEIAKSIMQDKPLARQKKVIDELADVQIMLWQLGQIYGADKVANRIMVKLERLEKRMDAET